MIKAFLCSCCLVCTSYFFVFNKEKAVCGYPAQMYLNGATSSQPHDLRITWVLVYDNKVHLEIDFDFHMNCVYARGGQ